MNDARDAVIRVLTRLPSDASLAEIRYEFETAIAVLEGLQDDGPTVSHAEMMEMIRQWSSKSDGRKEAVKI